MSARVYVVRGSEDGNVGVYSSRGKAYERALQYLTVENDVTEDDIVFDDDRKVTRRAVVSELGKYSYVDLQLKYSPYTSCSIESFTMNLL